MFRVFRNSKFIENNIAYADSGSNTFNNTPEKTIWVCGDRCAYSFGDSEDNCVTPASLRHNIPHLCGLRALPGGSERERAREREREGEGDHCSLFSCLCES